MAERDISTDIGPILHLDEQQLRSAAITVCARARDVEEARYFLEALGLLDDLRSVGATPTGE